MIVVDTNVIVSVLVPSIHSVSVRKLWDIDPDWHAPAIWLSEFRNVMVTRFRHRLQTADDCALTFVSAVELVTVSRTHTVDGQHVLRVACQSSCSAYDCEFVALAQTLSVPLITFDNKLLRQFPTIASHPESPRDSP